MKQERNVYYKTLDEARESGEVDAWKESRGLNQDCAKAIDSAIYVRNYETYRFNLSAAAADVVGQFGRERTAAVVAANIRASLYDGRWSNENKRWAEERPELPHGTPYLNRHKTVLDGFAEIIRNPAFHEQDRDWADDKELFNVEIKSIAVFSDGCGAAYAEHKDAKNMPYGTTCAFPYSTWSLRAESPDNPRGGDILYSSGRYFKSAEEAREDFAARTEELRGSRGEPTRVEFKRTGITKDLADAKKTLTERNEENRDKPKEKKPSVRDER